MNWNYKNDVLKKVTKCGRDLYYASKELKIDREIVIAAVSNDGLSIRYASQELKNDKEVLSKAVSNNGYALCYASKRLQNDRDLLSLLEKNNKEAIEYHPVWYEGRMAVLAKYKEQEIIQNKINESLVSKEKLKKF
jgi:hypothetical protein